MGPEGRLESIVLRRDYELHKRFQNETIDADKRFMVGAGVNTHDFRERIPALVDAFVRRFNVEEAVEITASTPLQASAID